MLHRALYWILNFLKKIVFKKSRSHHRLTWFWIIYIYMCVCVCVYSLIDGWRRDFVFRISVPRGFLFLNYLWVVLAKNLTKNYARAKTRNLKCWRRRIKRVDQSKRSVRWGPQVEKGLEQSEFLRWQSGSTAVRVLKVIFLNE